MKYIRKIVISGLIGVLASFVGGFCLHPMTVQAMGNAPTMDMSASPVLGSGQTMNDSTDTYSGNDRPITALNLCVLNCVEKTPQAVAAKKFSVDWEMSSLSSVFVIQTPLFSESSSVSTGLSGAHPPTSDILSSVFKKE